jgi:hypothetical protein
MNAGCQWHARKTLRFDLSYTLNLGMGKRNHKPLFILPNHGLNCIRSSDVLSSHFSNPRNIADHLTKTPYHPEAIQKPAPGDIVDNRGSIIH